MIVALWNHGDGNNILSSPKRKAESLFSVAATDRKLHYPQFKGKQ
jgi:hypothetical protein